MMRFSASSVEDAAQSASETLSERAAMLIQNDILEGIWKPDEKLGIQALAARYGISPTPLREGLSRLATRDLVTAVGQKGFRVASLSKADLTDITLVRVMIEMEALQRSIEGGRDDWEAGIVSALHRFVRYIEREPSAVGEGNPEFDRLHKAFHRSLLEGCGSERLLRLHDDLYFQAYRYRRIMMDRYVAHERMLVDEHKRLAEVVLSRDTARAQAELAEHLEDTLNIVYGDKGPGESG